MGNTLKDRIKKLFGLHNPNYVFKGVRINDSGNIVYDDDSYIGVKTDSKNDKGEAQQKEQPYPVQRALKRIKEIDYITDVRIDEEFETTVDDFPENRLTITIDYLDVDFVKKMKKAGKCKLD